MSLVLFDAQKSMIRIKKCIERAKYLIRSYKSSREVIKCVVSQAIKPLLKLIDHQIIFSKATTTYNQTWKQLLRCPTQWKSSKEAFTDSLCIAFLKCLLLPFFAIERNSLFLFVSATFWIWDPFFAEPSTLGCCIQCYANRQWNTWCAFVTSCLRTSIFFGIPIP